jgi:anti-anti-sigma regulatory factor
MDPAFAVLRITSLDDFGRTFERAIERLLKRGQRNVVLVLHPRGSIHYQQVQWLTSLDRMVREAGGTLSLVILREDLRFTFRLLKWDKMFNVIERVKDISRVPRRSHFRKR